jgi:hypothetical protein
MDKRSLLSSAFRNFSKVVLLAGWPWVTTSIPAGAQPIRALWGYEPDRSSSAQDAVETLQDLGANAVFMSKVTPQLLQALHAANIKVYATLNVFGDNSVWTRYPQLRPMNSNGNLLAAKPGNGICPTQRWYWPRILRELQQKIDSGYDGVWLDFIRFSGHWEEGRPQLQHTCFCDSSLADFSRFTGILIPDSLKGRGATANGDEASAASSPQNAAMAAWILSHHRREWRNYLTSVIADFTARAKAQMAAKTQLVLGAFMVPWQREEFGLAMLDYLGQDYRKLREHIDIFSPMLYHELCNRDTDWVARFADYTAAETKKPVLPIIQCDIGEKHRVSDDEFAAVILNALDAPSQGVIIFNYTALVEAKQLRILTSAWQ